MWEKSSLNNSVTEGGFIPQSSSNKKPVHKMRLVPCTVHEILSAQQKGDVFISKTGTDINLVSIVGLIKSINLTSNLIDYEINDRTGSNITVKQYTEQEENENGFVPPSQWRVESYVKVIGHIKSQKGINFLNAIKITKLKNFNEVTHHILSVIYTHQSLKELSESIGQTNQMMEVSGSSVDNLRNKIITLFERNRDMGDGLSLAFIKSALSDYREQEIEKKVEFLVCEGFIYSTVSEDVFKLT